MVALLPSNVYSFTEEAILTGLVNNETDLSMEWVLAGWIEILSSILTLSLISILSLIFTLVFKVLLSEFEIVPMTDDS